MNIPQLIEESYGTAVAKGWHDEPRSYATVAALIHSELSEALEGLRAGNPPSEKIGEHGFSQAEEELADVCVRVFDYCGKENLDLDTAVGTISLPDPSHLVSVPESEVIADLHASVSVSLTEMYRLTELALLVMKISAFCEAHNWDLDGALAAKMSYNSGREYRHGGKKF